MTEGAPALSVRRSRWCNRPVPERPLIAVTTSEVREAQTVSPTRHGEPRQHEMALGLTYLRAIERAGGLPVVVPPLDADGADGILERVDGLCLSGGPDVTPAAYGALPHPQLGPTERRLDEFELTLTRAADARGMPMLAICRGLQVLNVARGGTLLQHLPDEVGETVVHRQSEPGGVLTHWVRLDPDSRVARTLNRRRAKVNSFHHQAIDRLGRNLVVTASAPDGTIEGIEPLDRDNVIAVQWHAECLTDRREQAALFSWLIGAAADFKRGGAIVTRAA